MSEAAQQQSERGADHLEPGDAEGHLARAAELTAAGPSPEALAAVRAALRLCPDRADLHAWVGCYLAREARRNADRTADRTGTRGDPAEVEAAVAAFQQAADLDPANSYALSCLGQLQGWLGDRRKAIKTLKAAVAAGADDFRTFDTLARYQGRMLHLRRMIQTVNALNALPDSPERDEHYKQVYRLAARVEVALVAAGCAAACLAAFLIWRRRRG